MESKPATSFDPTRILPPGLLSELENICFRSASEAARREHLVSLLSHNPGHDAAIRGFLQGLGVSFPGESGVRQIGPYRILSELGRGGFGEVYLAEQEVPVRRRVALKVLKLGMDSRAILARFTREQASLARMNHDAVAKIFDAGTTPQGQSFFAMELVEGQPITQYCDEHRLDLRQRIELFQRVCLGVQHAHQKGVVHRDLKPGNVLVAKVGDLHAPKLIDFGIARAIEGDDAEAGLTETGMVLGTPAYMAPEQAKGDPGLVDTRTDVYALGAILYQLLTGAQPFVGQVGGTESPWALRQRILAAETPRPSLRAADDTTTLAQRAQHRRMAPSTWLRTLRGDLDWIVLKAMAKAAEDRYGSAAELAADLGRYLQQEPVLAGPPSAVYRLRKFVRRYRGQVLAVGLVVAAIVVGTVTTFAQYRRAENEAQLSYLHARAAEAAAEVAKAEALRAGTAERSATAALAQAESTAAFLTSVFDHSDVARLGAELRKGLIDALLRKRSAALDSGTDQASLRIVVDESVAGVQFADLAKEVLVGGLLLPAADRARKEMSEALPVQARLLVAIGGSVSTLGDSTSGAALRRDGWRMRATALGEDHALTLAALQALCAGIARVDGEDCLRLAADGEVRARRALGEHHEVALGFAAAQASALHGLGRLADAELAWRKVLAVQTATLGPQHELSLASVNDLAAVLNEQGRRDEALRLLRGLDLTGLAATPQVIATANLAACMKAEGQFQEALDLIESGIPRFTAALGATHEHVVRIDVLRAECLWGLGRKDDALALLRPLHGEVAETRGAFSREFALVGHHLAHLLSQSGDLDSAADIGAQVLRAFDAVAPRDDPGAIATLNNLAGVRNKQGRFDEAEVCYREVVDRWAGAGQHPFHAGALNNLAIFVEGRGRLDEATAIWGVAYNQSLSLPVLHKTRVAASFNLVRKLLLRDAASAAVVAGEFLEVLAAEAPAKKVLRCSYLVERCRAYCDLGQYAAAELDCHAAVALMAATNEDVRSVRVKLAQVMVTVYDRWGAELGRAEIVERAGPWRCLLESEVGATRR